MKTSDKQDKFESGAQRDSGAGKGCPHMIPPLALQRLAKHYESGGKAYGSHNWLHGMPLARLYDSAFRHLAIGWLGGDRSEDHLAACLWNVVGLMITEDKVLKGELTWELVQKLDENGNMEGLPPDLVKVLEKIREVNKKDYIAGTESIEFLTEK